MKHKKWIYCVVAITGLVILNSFASIELSRKVRVDTSRNEIRISRYGRVLAMMTPEGPFPSWQNQVTIIPYGKISRGHAASIKIPQDASVMYDEVASGSVTLDPAWMSARVHFEWQPGYRMLDFDGRYPLVFTE